MEERLDQEISREELSKLYHMNPVYFSRAFQKIYKLTPMQMLRKLRLQQAKQMLEYTDYTIEHISQRCGYYDASHFSKVFRGEYGRGPAEYRKVSNIQKQTSLLHSGAFHIHLLYKHEQIILNCPNRCVTISIKRKGRL